MKSEAEQAAGLWIPTTTASCPIAYSVIEHEMTNGKSKNSMHSKKLNSSLIITFESIGCCTHTSIFEHCSWSRRGQPILIERWTEKEIPIPSQRHCRCMIVYYTAILIINYNYRCVCGVIIYRNNFWYRLYSINQAYNCFWEIKTSEN